MFGGREGGAVFVKPRSVDEDEGVRFHCHLVLM